MLKLLWYYVTRTGFSGTRMITLSSLRKRGTRQLLRERDYVDGDGVACVVCVCRRPRLSIVDDHIQAIIRVARRRAQDEVINIIVDRQQPIRIRAFVLEFYRATQSAQRNLAYGLRRPRTASQ